MLLGLLSFMTNFHKSSKISLKKPHKVNIYEKILLNQSKFLARKGSIPIRLQQF